MKAIKAVSTLSPKCCVVSWWKLLTKMSQNKVRSSGSLASNDDIVKAGYLKKLKDSGVGLAQEAMRILEPWTMKKKYFVLRRETGPDSPARLEYYDSEKKFKAGAQPKKTLIHASLHNADTLINESSLRAPPPCRPIILRTCFCINRKKDPKHSHVIALYTNHDSVSMAAESEDEFNDWLGLLKHYMHQADGQSRKLYEHVWMVEILPRSLGSSKGMTGEYHICLTYKSIALVRVGENQKKVEFPLNSIKRCGHTGSFFFLGLGRSAVTGAGDIWMLTEDAVIAENMHSIIRGAMHAPCSEDLVPKERVRTHSMSNQLSFDSKEDIFCSGQCLSRYRSDSMPSRSRTSSEGSMQTGPNKLPRNCSHQMDGPHPGSVCLHPITRPKSMYSSSLSSSCSPPCPSALFSPSSSESMESTASVEDFDGLHSHTPETAVDNSNGEEDYMPMEAGLESNTSQHRDHPQPPFSLPFGSMRSYVHSLSKGLISPLSVSSTEGPCLSSPQDQYLVMLSPQERAQEGQFGSMSDRSTYLCMDRTPNQPSASSGPESSGYLPMAPLNSPVSSLPAWQSHPSSQVSSPPHSANHSRIPSLVDENTDSYLSMVPGGHGDATTTSSDTYARDRSRSYLDMTPTPAVPTPIPCSPSDGDSFPEMSPGSSCSFTSGTPSSDHRLHDFIAEKSGNGSYCGYSEDDDSSLDRPHRTNSVGSKPEQFRSRKNRLEVSPAEPARVRAFSVGSRVSLRLAGGRAGQVAGGTATATSASVTEFSPSIKEKGKQVKSKSSSAPILGTSPISNSWSGTPGTFFRGFLQARNQERNNDLMEFDFTKNKSCDSMSAEKEKKSSSIESIKRTFTGQRHRSNSKSSGNGKSSVFDSMKRDKKKSESELSAKGMEIPEGKSPFELDFTPSPRGGGSDVCDGYLPMNLRPAVSSGQSSANSEYLEMNSKDLFTGHGLNDPYLDMSKSSDRLVSSLSTSGPNDGYVDMSQGKGLGTLPLTPASSSSTTSNSSSSIGARVRKISSTFNPLSSQDFSSQQDEYMPIDLRGSFESSHSLDGEKSKKKKSSKRKSFKDSTKRKKSDPIAVMGKGSDGENTQESSKKGTSPLSSLSTFLGRKNSSGTPPKTPLSPTSSPLPKSSRGTPSPFSSLTRKKSESKDSSKDGAAKESSGVSSSVSSGIGTSCIRESSREAEESAISGDSSSVASSSQTVPNSGDQLNKQTNSNGGSKRTSGIFETSQADTKLEEKQKNTGLESGNTDISINSQQQHSNINSNDMGAYVNLSLGSSDKNLIVENKQRKVSTGSVSSDYMNVSPMSACKTPEAPSDPHQPREYVNMCPGGRPEPLSTSLIPPQPASMPGTVSPKRKTSLTSKGESSEKSSPSLGYGGSRDQNRRDSKRLSGSNYGEENDGSSGESGYLLMTPGQTPPKPVSPRTVTRRPDIPSALLGGRPDASLTATLERLNLGSSGGSATSERCRSHSGPGAPESSAVGGEVRVKKQLSEPRAGSGSQGSSGRAASACSSPVSYSPPTSPTLRGSVSSVSSVSSLSEGALSSASSTCTVVNVGVGRRESGLGGSGRAQETPVDSASHTSVSSSSTSQQSTSTASSGCSSGDSGLNYVSLDLAPARCEGVMPSPLAGRRSTSGAGVPHTVCLQEPAVGEEDEPLSYAQIDFTKSEGLRTTSLTRDKRH
ncbi:serine-rich adhesin for platelets-like isoform X3 [Penaeus chinensis]|uniref:serine-rich adhesin for platelets-like isoform X3 n=1 Tax=Penaeus chinensis TaxID=139456 RepID=UPI001FB803D9|nr:serine-rich adhesin for platelets-like isoform X3 [Penaeus chinensis]